MNSFKTGIILTFVLGVAQAKANMVCEVMERSGEQSLSQEVKVEIQNDNPHGSLQMFNLQKFTTFSGMVAYLRGYAVISIHDTNSGFAISSQAKLGINEIAHQQIILPSKDSSLQAITVDCKLVD
jgi:hypothetical protein